MRKQLNNLAISIIICIVSLMAGCGENAVEMDTPEAQDTSYDVETRLEEMGIHLSTPLPPVANFVQAVRSGNLVFLAGHGPRLDDGTFLQGKVGRDIGIEEGQKAARITGINLLKSLKAEIGDLNKVTRIVKVLGMVNSDESFTDQPKVMNGFSDLMVSVFGQRGKHARSAVGMVSLPFGIPCEIEMIVEIADE